MTEKKPSFLQLKQSKLIEENCLLAGCINVGMRRDLFYCGVQTPQEAVPALENFGCDKAVVYGALGKIRVGQEFKPAALPNL